MAGVNKVIIVGNLGKDPEISYTGGGMAVCKFSLATSRKQKDGTDKTSWHRCTAFNKAAELIGQYVAKGQQLYVEGELSYGQYEKDGHTVYTTDIIVNQFSFIGSKGNGNQGSQQQQQGGNGGYQQQGGYQNQGGGQPQGGGYQNQGGGGQPQGNGGRGYQQGEQNQGGGNQNQGGGYQGGMPQGGVPDDEIPF